MKKIFAILLSLVTVLSLVSCDTQKLLSELENLVSNELANIETSAPEDTDDISEATESNVVQGDKENDYDPSAWVTDNLSISFYYLYQEGSETSELNTLKVCGNRAVMFTQKGGEEPLPGTYYEETDNGLVQTTLLHFGESKTAYQSKPLADKSFKTSFPYIMLVAGTFGCRVDSNPLKGLEKAGEEMYIGRLCDVYEKSSAFSKQTMHVDRETGIILKNESTTIIDGETSTLYSVLVTELVYGKTTEEEVTVDLSSYKMAYEGSDETE